MSDYFQTMLGLLDEQSTLQAMLMFLGTSLCVAFRSVYKDINAKSDAISSLQVYTIDDNLMHLLKNAPEKRLKYAAVTGLVGTTSDVLQSTAKPNITGVANLKMTTEVKDKWLSHSKTWHNEDSVMSLVLDQVPFNIYNKSNSKLVVNVHNPTDSEWFRETLRLVSKEFTPKSEDSLFESVVNMTSGERLRGYSKTERMLQLGVNLLVIGELRLDEDGIRICAPAKAVYEFIVTRNSQSDIVSRLNSTSFAWKVATSLSFAATLATAYLFCRRIQFRYNLLQRKKRQRLDFEVIRRRRSSSAGPDSPIGPCVVCLSNPRECVLLDCGHVCICADCLERLPLPLRCPVCRENVLRCLPIFHT